MKGAEQQCRELASKRFGLILRSAAREAGLSSFSCRARVNAGEWLEPFPGVYFVGSVIPDAVRLIAACWWVGSDALVSHSSAAGLHRFAFEPASQELHLSTTRHVFKVGVRDVVVHSRRQLAGYDRALAGNVPVTSEERTMLDLCATVPLAEAEILLEDLLNRRRIFEWQLRAMTSRLTGCHGVKALGKLMELRGKAEAPAGSALEVRFIQLLRKYGLPRPARQVSLGSGPNRQRVDFYWEAARIVVEVDGRSGHAREKTWRLDVRRRTSLQAGGTRVLVFTYREICFEEADVVATLRRALDIPRQSEFSL